MVLMTLIERVIGIIFTFEGFLFLCACLSLLTCGLGIRIMPRESLNWLTVSTL